MQLLLVRAFRYFVCVELRILFDRVSGEADGVRRVVELRKEVLPTDFVNRVTAAGKVNADDSNIIVARS